MADALTKQLILSLETMHERLRKALEGLSAETLDRVPVAGANSIAVIVAHMTGSELGWLHVAAGRPFERDREAEFRVRGKSAEELRALVDRATSLAPELVREATRDFAARRPTRDGREVSAAYAVVHALDHLAEHVGHVELTRQLLDAR